jgi:hypothetical protein
MTSMKKENKMNERMKMKKLMHECFKILKAYVGWYQITVRMAAILYGPCAGYDSLECTREIR